MNAINRLIVVSDLHLAPQLARSTGFESFLEHLLISPACHLVIAGDLFDFLVAADLKRQEAFDPFGTPGRLRESFELHSKLFSLLRTLSEANDFSLTVLGGNHDIELALPSAQSELLLHLGPHVRWLVHGEAFGASVNGVQVLVEHGDLYDDWNRVDYGQLTIAGRLLSRGEAPNSIDPPPGSLIVTRFLNTLRPNHIWLEWIKPEEALVPLLHALLTPRERMKLMSLLGPYIEHSSRSIERRLLRAAGSGRMIRSSKGNIAPTLNLATWYKETRNSQYRTTANQREEKLLSRLGRIATSGDFFNISSPDKCTAELSRLSRFSTLQLVILGHTHAAKAIPLDSKLLYMNAGAWCPLVPLPLPGAKTSEWRDFLSALRTNSLEPRWRNTYIQVEATNEGAQASLYEWIGIPQLLSNWHWNHTAYWTSRP